MSRLKFNRLGTNSFASVWQSQTVSGLVQNYMFFPAKHRDCYLTFVLNELAGQSCIIFVSKCEQAQV